METADMGLFDRPRRRAIESAELGVAWVSISASRSTLSSARRRTSKET